MGDEPKGDIRPMPSHNIAIDAIEQRGCGAWVDDHGCGIATGNVVIGQTELLFATYLNVADKSGTTYAFLCERHHPEHGPARLIQDMDPKILWRQRREMRKMFKLQGRQLGKPNLMEP